MVQRVGLRFACRGSRFFVDPSPPVLGTRSWLSSFVGAINCHHGQLAEPWSHCHTIQREPLHAYQEKTTYAGVYKRGQIFCLGHRSRAAARKVGPDAGKPLTSQGQSFPRRVSLSPLRRKTKNKMSRVASCLLLACWHIYTKTR